MNADSHSQHSHAHSHDHGLGRIRHERPLRRALWLTGGFLLVEVAMGLWSNSLALLSDAGHMATDTLALAVALFAVRLSQRPPDARRTYGYARLEALGALFNGSLLFVVALWVLWEAIARFAAPPPVHSLSMAIVAALGLAVNLWAMRLLREGSEESLNLRGAYLEVWSDMLGSLAVLVGAGLMWWTGWRLIDPVLAVLIGLWVLPRTASLLRDAVNILLEGTPKGLDIEAVRAALRAAPEVEDLHDLHVWSLASHARALTAHVVLRESLVGDDALRERLTHRLAHDFDIGHVTLQFESARCDAPACEHGHAR
ncbi:cation diffusion facilitator family transporter [Arenimonas sp.]|uniref:cation diffusion facilitator family transporter n=1 Tax=Arenimonas sp. TaxID=1872635 RepID=UPI0039E2B036